MSTDNKPLCLDLFCKAGGTSRGYQMAGFYVVGVDIEPQKNYIGDDFIQADALEILRILIVGGCIIGKTGRRYWLSDFSLIAASPPCQFGSECTPIAYRSNHKNYIPETRELLRAAGEPYVIENVEAVRKHLISPILLCGSMFGLNLERHRYFEIYPNNLFLVPSCNHSEYPVLITGTTRRKSGRFKYTADECREASGLHWMTRKEMDQAIPPAYTYWVGRQMLEMIRVEA